MNNAHVAIGLLPFCESRLELELGGPAYRRMQRLEIFQGPVHLSRAAP